ncbi:MAG: DUF433 domain-containing protein [Planctomycetota bacterium]|jgi:uncharacterized protein (DUF433 family)|nr:DUF433 domain-containing protein [Planctomycetota bacterium]
MKLVPGIEATEDVLGGKPRIAGTRLSVEFVLEQLGSGMSISALQQAYGISDEQMLAVFRYASDALGGDVIREVG